MCKILMSTKHWKSDFPPQSSLTESHANCSRKAFYLKEVEVTMKVACFEIYYITEKKEKELVFSKDLL